MSTYDDLIARLSMLTGDERVQDEAADAIAALVAERDAAVAALRLIQHATAPTPEGDGGYHENAYELATAALAARQHTAQGEKIAWHKSPSKTEFGADIVIADSQIDKDHTLTMYCERDQIDKVPGALLRLLTQPAAPAQRLDAIPWPTVLRYTGGSDMSSVWIDDRKGGEVEYVKAPAQPVEQPIDEPCPHCGAYGDYAFTANDMRAARAAPAQPAVPLTERQIRDIARDADLDWQRGYPLDGLNRYVVFARAIERAAQEKP